MNLKALARLTALTMWLITAMTIASELSAPFKAFLTGITGHHWTTKSVISIAFFMTSYFVIEKMYSKKTDMVKEVKYVIVSGIRACLAIFVFFVYEFVA